MEWIEISIAASPVGIEPVCARLLAAGVKGFVINDPRDFQDFLDGRAGNWDYIDDGLKALKDAEPSVTVYLPDNRQGKEMFAAVKSEIAMLSAADGDGLYGRLELSFKNVKEEDWANNWKQYFKPFDVGERLTVKPSWEPLDSDSGRALLEIDPASSFGTGQHETTRLCLELLEKHIKGGERLLDVGCGSGILSIAAVLLGAGFVLAVDIDENSVNTARENARKNKLPPEKYGVLCGNILADKTVLEKIGGGYDVITANITADILILMSPLFPALVKKGGIILLSGIIDEFSQGVIDAAEAQGFSIAEQCSNNGWTALSCFAPPLAEC